MARANRNTKRQHVAGCLPWSISSWIVKPKIRTASLESAYNDKTDLGATGEWPTVEATLGYQNCIADKGTKECKANGDAATEKGSEEDISRQEKALQTHEVDLATLKAHAKNALELNPGYGFMSCAHANSSNSLSASSSNNFIDTPTKCEEVRDKLRNAIVHSSLTLWEKEEEERLRVLNTSRATVTANTPTITSAETISLLDEEESDCFVDVPIFSEIVPAVHESRGSSPGSNICASLGASVPTNVGSWGGCVSSASTKRQDFPRRGLERRGSMGSNSSNDARSQAGSVNLSQASAATTTIQQSSPTNMSEQPLICSRTGVLYTPNVVASFRWTGIRSTVEKTMCNARTYLERDMEREKREENVSKQSSHPLHAGKSGSLLGTVETSSSKGKSLIHRINQDLAELENFDSEDGTLETDSLHGLLC